MAGIFMADPNTGARIAQGDQSFGFGGFTNRVQGGGGGSTSQFQSESRSGPPEGLADLINQAADESIQRLGAGLERAREGLLQGFTERGLRRSGLAAGAAANLEGQALDQQRSIERERLGRLAALQSRFSRSSGRGRSGPSRGGVIFQSKGFGSDDDEGGGDGGGVRRGLNILWPQTQGSLRGSNFLTAGGEGRAEMQGEAQGAGQGQAQAQAQAAGSLAQSVGQMIQDPPETARQALRQNR